VRAKNWNNTSFFFKWWCFLEKYHL